MLRLLAMILTAYDSRRNPAAGLLRSTASHVLDSVAKLAETSPGADALAATADNYTKIREDAQGQYDTRPVYRVLTDSGNIVYVRAARYA
jgi:hypothetical protein